MPEAKETFLLTSRPVDIIPDEIFSKQEPFTVVLYNSSIQKTSVNEARKELFTRREKQLGKLPPMKASLREHILQTAYQAGHV